MHSSREKFSCRHITAGKGLTVKECWTPPGQTNRALQKSMNNLLRFYEATVISTLSSSATTLSPSSIALIEIESGTSM